MDIAVGDTIGGYRILGELGHGGMGVVYRAFDDSLQRLVALKMLPEKRAQNKAFVDRFIREAQAAAQLSHPNVVHVYAVGEHEGRYFLAMELVEGKPLSHYIAKYGRLEVKRALYVARQAAKGLVAAHSHGIVHRDIKPQNIMIDRGGYVKVMDFGLAKVVSTPEGITKRGTMMGTPAYMAPEQVRGESSDGRIDVYALGVTLFEMLAGQVPFLGETRLALMYQILETPLPDLREINPQVPVPVVHFIERMTAKDPEQRIPSAAMARDDLAILLRGGNPTWPKVRPETLPSQSKMVRLDDELRAELVNLVASRTSGETPAIRQEDKKPRLDKFRLRVGGLVAGILLLMVGGYLALDRFQESILQPEVFETVTQVFHFNVIAARVALALAVLITWPLTLIFLANWLGTTITRATDIAIGGLVCGGLAFLCLWAPIRFLGYACLPPLALSLAVVTMTFQSGWLRILTAWAISILVTAGVGCGILVACEGRVALKDIAYVVAYARVYDRMPDASVHALGTVEAPWSRVVHWQSTHSPWLDAKVEDVALDLRCSGTPSPVKLVIARADGTPILSEQVRGFPYRAVFQVQPSDDYRLAVETDHPCILEIAINSIMKPRLGDDNTL